MNSTAGFDDDDIIIGSGFGGSVSSLRWSEKGYTVAVLAEYIMSQRPARGQ